MHEFSIVSSLLESCEEIARENSAQRVCKVIVEIGERSGVNAELLQSAFSEFKIGSVCQNAELFIESIPIALKCANCNKVSIPKTLDYTHCPNCKSKEVTITQGNSMLLKRLEME